MSARSLRRQRQGHILNLEKLIAEVRDASDISVESISFLETKLSRYETEINKLNEKIAVIIENEEEELRENSQTVDLFEKIADSFARLNALSCRLKTPASNSLPDPDSTSIMADSSGGLKAVRLPKLQLKKFSGNPLEWQEFIDMFNVSVHESDLPAIQKFVHLKSLLSNDAALCIANIELSANNYSIAYERLSARYGDEERQRHRLINRLVNLPAMDIKELTISIDYVDNLVSTVRALEKFGVNQEQYGTVILPVIESKLPVGWRLQWTREKEATGDRSFNSLLSFLEREIRIRQSAEVGMGESRRVGQLSKAPEVKSSAKSWRAVPTASALPAVTRNNRTCIFCQGNPLARVCEKKMSIADRWRLVRSSRACFKCGMVGHRKDKCFYRGICGVCKGDHISMLCERSESLSVQPKEVSLSEGVAKSSSVVSLSNSVSNVKKSVFLRTCAVKVNNLFLARVLCDTGCNRTFIKRDLVDKCGIKVSCRQSLSINSVGGISSDGIFDVVQFKLHGFNTDAVVEVEAFVVDNPIVFYQRFPIMLLGE